MNVRELGYTGRQYRMSGAHSSNFSASKGRRLCNLMFKKYRYDFR